MPARAEEYTLGIEEEHQIVDPGTRGLVSRGGRVVERARRTVGEDEVAAELLESQVETVIPVCHTLADARAEVLRLRRGVIEAAEAEGKRIVAASTHPFSHWQEQVITPKERYRRSWRPTGNWPRSSSSSGSTYTWA